MFVAALTKAAEMASSNGLGFWAHIAHHFQKLSRVTPRPDISRRFQTVERISLHPPRVDADGRESYPFHRMNPHQSDNQDFFQLFVDFHTDGTLVYLKPVLWCLSPPTCLMHGEGEKMRNTPYLPNFKSVSSTCVLLTIFLGLALVFRAGERPIRSQGGRAAVFGRIGRNN